MRQPTLTRAAAFGSRLGDRERYALQLAVVALAYFGTAKAGLAFASSNGSITAFWPPTGLALAAVLLGGYRMLPGVLVGAFAANATTDAPFASAFGIAAGNTLEAFTGAYLLARVRGFDPSLKRMSDVLALVVCGAVLSTIVSATIGVASLWATGGLSADELASSWRVWWLGDMAGDLLVAPAILVLALRPQIPVRPHGPLEFWAALIALAGLAAFVFAITGPITFVLLPALFWIAIRYRRVGAVLASLIVSGIGLWYTARGHGTFVTGTDDANILRCQLFAGIAALTSLLVAVETDEREELEGKLSKVRAAAAENERRRWARELHDGTLQGLSAVQINLALAARSEGPESRAGAMDSAVAQIESEISKLRALITELRPATLDEFGIEASIVELAGKASQFGVDVDLDLDLAFEKGRESTRHLPELEIAVYRVVQEALNNIYKHSQAETAKIRLREDDHTVSVMVRDDGAGFDPDDRGNGGFGLVGMRERAELYGGGLTVSSGTGAGTTVSASFPAQRRRARAR